MKTKRPEYWVWLSMKQRCSNPRSKVYEYYGGRGIQVCERWLKFENFIADMGARPSDTHSIDRRDNDGNYEPANCTWASKRAQAINRGLSSNNATGFKGVRFKGGKWYARITNHYREVQLGHYDTIEEAAEAYNEAARLLHGKHGWRNAV